MEFVPLLLALSGPAQAGDQHVQGKKSAESQLDDLMTRYTNETAIKLGEQCVDVRYSQEPAREPDAIDRKLLSRDEWTFQWNQGAMACYDPKFGPPTCELKLTAAKKADRGKMVLNNTGVLVARCVTPALSGNFAPDSEIWPNVPNLDSWESTIGLR